MNKFATQLKDLDKTTIKDENVKDESPLFDSDNTEDNYFEEGDYSGQLAVDVYQTIKEIIIKSTIAGVQPEDIDISINNDMVTIKGIRRQPEVIPEENYIYKECHWGGFSRSIILPVDIKEDKIKANLKNGILTIILPKAGKSKVKVVEVEEETES
ncbi:Hsp20/alpha crystallin family protein [Patescibacteria group bacterium]|nr:Hsp20/alpha crystallin family protein [Patescibacteria group bacterium]